MIVESGKFYFIKDNFFDKFKNFDLMQNKENGNKRPCYFCFKDSDIKEIIWFVPITSKVKKYIRIYESKKKKQKRVYNFVFGNVLGKEKVFLIQNIFPTTKKYIESKYINKNEDVNITVALKRKVIQTSKNVIELSKRGINIPFYDINKMKNILLSEIK